MATDRYGTTVAPGGLGLVHRLANTVGVTGAQEDQLADRARAQAWFAEAVGEWAADGRTAPALRITVADLAPMCALRAGLARAIAGEDAGMTGAAQLSLGAGGRPSIDPRGRTAAEWLRSAVLAESLAAQLSGTWPRLKVCANPVCPTVFYDRSRNRSGAWHDVTTCGNRVNLRASRARRRQAERA